MLEQVPFAGIVFRTSRRYSATLISRNRSHEKARFPPPDRIKLALLKRHLARSIGGDGRARTALAVLDRSDGISPLQVSLHKGEFGIGVGLDLAAAMDQPFVYRMLYARLPTMLRIFSQAAAKVRMVAADLSDGGDPPVGGLGFLLVPRRCDPRRPTRCS